MDDSHCFPARPPDRRLSWTEQSNSGYTDRCGKVSNAAVVADIGLRPAEEAREIEKFRDVNGALQSLFRSPEFHQLLPLQSKLRAPLATAFDSWDAKGWRITLACRSTGPVSILGIAWDGGSHLGAVVVDRMHSGARGRKGLVKFEGEARIVDELAEFGPICAVPRDDRIKPAESRHHVETAAIIPTRSSPAEMIDRLASANRTSGRLVSVVQTSVYEARKCSIAGSETIKSPIAPGRITAAHP